MTSQEFSKLPSFWLPPSQYYGNLSKIRNLSFGGNICLGTTIWASQITDIPAPNHERHEIDQSEEMEGKQLNEVEETQLNEVKGEQENN